MDLNQEQIRLRDVTREAVCSETELFDLGLHLGYTIEQIKQKRTNHPYSMENAALDMTCEWWDSDQQSDIKKIEVLKGAVTRIGKVQLGSRVKSMLCQNLTSNEFVIAEKVQKRVSKYTDCESFALTKKKQLSVAIVFKWITLLIPCTLLAISFIISFQDMTEELCNCVFFCFQHLYIVVVIDTISITIVSHAFPSSMLIGQPYVYRYTLL